MVTGAGGSGTIDREHMAGFLLTVVWLRPLWLRLPQRWRRMIVVEVAALGQWCSRVRGSGNGKAQLCGGPWLQYLSVVKLDLTT